MSSWFETTISLSVATTILICLIKLEIILSYYHCNREMSSFLVNFYADTWNWVIFCFWLKLSLKSQSRTTSVLCKFTDGLRMCRMNTSLMSCKTFLQFVGTSMLIIASYVNYCMLIIAFVLVKSSKRMYPIMPDFLFAGRRFSCSDKKRGWAWFSLLKVSQFSKIFQIRFRGLTGDS